jgi:hypothetical protein
MGKSSPGAAPAPAPVAPFTAPASQVLPSTPLSPGFFPTSSFVAPPNPTSEIPATNTYQQDLEKAANVENFLPSWLQLGETNPLDTSSPQFKQAENNYLAQNVNPQVASDEANLNSGGQDYGSYAGALVASDQAAGNLAAYNAGLDYETNAFNAQTAGRNEYFNQNVGTVVGANQSAINNALSLANLQTQQAQNQNSFNLQQNQNEGSFNLTSANNQNTLAQEAANASNQFNLSTAQQQNQFNLGTQQNTNSFNTSVFGTKASVANNNNNNTFRLLGAIV